jgi:Abortive infection alpha
MGEENKIRDAADAVKGVLEVASVYQDGLQPAVKEIGTALGKAIHIALAPIWVMDWTYNKASEYLNSILPNKLKDIPPERIVTPNPAIVGSAVDALRFAINMNEPDLREMYANLIATSMDKETARNAHPAFVDMIRQMTADEAKIFSTIATERDRLVNISLVRILGISFDMTPPDKYRYAYLIQKSKCVSPALIPAYLDNLQRLKLTQHDTDGWYAVTYHPGGTITSSKKGSISHPAPADDIGLLTIVKSIVDDKLQAQVETAVELSAYHEIVYLTAFGRQFADACVFPK